MRVLTCMWLFAAAWPFAAAAHGSELCGVAVPLHVEAESREILIDTRTQKMRVNRDWARWSLDLTAGSAVIRVDGGWNGLIVERCSGSPSEGRVDLHYLFWDAGSAADHERLQADIGRQFSAGRDATFTLWFVDGKLQRVEGFQLLHELDRGNWSQAYLARSDQTIGTIRRTIEVRRLSQSARAPASSGGGGPSAVCHDAPSCRDACDANAGEACRYSGLVEFNRDPAQAEKLLARGCELKDAIACHDRGVLLVRRRDAAGAEALFDKACRMAPGGICLSLGVVLEDRGDVSGAAAAFERACSTRDGEACGRLALMLAQGNGVKRDEARALALYRISCDGENPAGCNNLGLMLAARDPIGAVDAYDRGCTNGNGPACFNLGTLFQAGTGVAKDSTRAVALFQRGCESSSGGGCRELARSIDAGLHSDLSVPTLLEKACAANDLEGCSLLGVRYATGRDVARDLTRAAGLFERACTGGVMGACMTLGTILRQRGDHGRARELFQKSCSSGELRSCLHLGDMYEAGQGTPVDHTAAVRQWTRACDGSIAAACQKLGR